MTEVLDDARTLSVGGFAVDEVERVLPRPFEDSHESVLDAFRCTSQDWRTRKKERRKRLRNMIRTWITETDHLGRRLSQETINKWLKGSFMSTYEESDFDEDECSKYEHLGDQHPEDKGDDDEDSEEELGYSRPRDEVGYSRYIDGMIGFEEASKNSGRNFLRTREGCMAFGPIGALAGDIIFIFYQCSVPLLLRKDTDVNYFRLVGECYVHGLVDGEALRWRKRPSNFKIR
jgi:hypothetical protein